MTTATAPTKIHVTSLDGTDLAVFASGVGRPLVVVPGTTSDHQTLRLVQPLLGQTVQVHAMDRRGRGASGDSTSYALAREYEDVAAVVDAAAAAYGGPVDVFGHSYGGNVAFGAALPTRSIRSLALYEGWPMPNPAHRTVPADVLARLDALLAAGRSAELLDTMYRDLVHMSDEEVDAIRSAPTWPDRLAAAVTVPREIRAFCEQEFDPAQAALIRVPVLLLVGGDSPAKVRGEPETVAAAIPDARIAELAGQMHMAHLTDPEQFARTLLGFLGE